MRDYHSQHLVDYEPPKREGYDSIVVLPFLTGRKWDEIALAYVHALRPACIRVTQDWMTSDSHTWRVTVIVDDADVIKSIEQEVAVGLPEHITSGHHLKHAMHYGMDSPQERFWREDPDNPTTGYVYMQNKCLKTTRNGPTVQYPDREGVKDE